MAKQLSDRTELAEVPALGDLLWVRDISDTTDSAGGTDKKITFKNIFAGWTPRLNDAAPNATREVAQFSAENAGTTTDVDVAITPKGAGALSAHVADGTATGGNKRGSYSVDFQLSRSSGNQVAAMSHSVVLGGSGNQISPSGGYCGVICGQNNKVIDSGTYGNVIVGGRNNTVQGGHNDSVVGGGSNNVSGGVCSVFGGGNSSQTYYSVVAGGKDNSVNGNSSNVNGRHVICGGEGNVISGGWNQYMFLGGGHNNQVSGQAASLAGGENNSALGSYSAVVGGHHAVAALRGQHANANGMFAADGDAQRSSLVARVSTSDAVSTLLSLDGSTINIPDNTTWEARIRIVAREAAGADQASFWRRALITKDGTAGSTTLVGSSTPDPDIASAGASGWSVSLGADTTNGALQIYVTGDMSTNIRWVAEIELVEVGYA